MKAEYWRLELARQAAGSSHLARAAPLQAVPPHAVLPPTGSLLYVGACRWAQCRALGEYARLLLPRLRLLAIAGATPQRAGRKYYAVSPTPRDCIQVQAVP